MAIIGLMKTTQTTPCRRFTRRLRIRFPRVSRVGIYACRHIAGSTSWSQHSWGNAIDVFGPQSTLARVARWASRPRRSRRLAVQTVIWHDRVWSAETGQWSHYSGIPHVAHVHVDFRPRRYGTPPCA